MQNKYKWLCRMVVVALVCAGACEAARAAEKMAVFVSIVPQQYFLQQIGGDRLQIEVMVQPGASPATYEPRPRQMVALTRAKAYFAIGAPFERAWLDKIAAANPSMPIVHTDQGIEKLPMATHVLDHPAQEANETHDHGYLDPHIWLSPRRVIIQAQTILAALKHIDPAHAHQYQADCDAFVNRLQALDAQLTTWFENKQGLEFMVFHPSWGYFAHDYGLVQVPVEIEGKSPKPAQLGQLIAHARARQIKIIFAQPQFSTKSVQQIAREIDGRVVFADPLALNWSDNLRSVADAFGAALK